jgi:PST family polysaccharide transporter
VSPPPEIAAGVVEHPELDAGPTAHQELDVTEVKRRAVRGVGSMFVRSLGQRGLQMVGNVLLARWLAPKTVGLYAIVSFFVGMAGFLSDLGLGASLIQRRERLTERDMRTAFTLNLLFNVGAVAVLWTLSKPLVHAYHAEQNLAGVRVMALTILMSTFTIIPAIKLERELHFGRIAFADLAGQVAYLVVALSLAYRYWHHPAFAEQHAAGAVWCFIWGTVASRTLYTVLLLAGSRWRLRLQLDRKAMREMLSFGLPYQLNGLVNVLKDNFVPTFVALVVADGAREVGFLTWAIGLATNALFLMPIVQRVTFPAFSRLQHDREALRGAVESSIKWVAATVFPTTLILAALARQIVEHIYGPKWAPGIVPFYLLCIPMLNAAYSTVLVSALYGLGRAKTVLRLTTIWAVAGWAIGAPLTILLGKNGFALSMSIVSLMSVMSVREMNKVVKVRFAGTLLRIGACAAIPSFFLAAFSRFVVHNAYQLAGLAVAGVGAYIGLMYLFGELDELGSLVRMARARRRAKPQQSANAVAEHA